MSTEHSPVNLSDPPDYFARVEKIVAALERFAQEAKRDKVNGWANGQVFFYVTEECRDEAIDALAAMRKAQ